MNQYEQYMVQAERWELKEAFDNFFGDARKYLHMRIDDPFTVEIHFIMDGIWNEQIRKPCQIYSND